MDFKLCIHGACDATCPHAHAISAHASSAAVHTETDEAIYI
jgi:hypothetical protein